MAAHLLDGYTFHVEVPEGENEVTADLDYCCRCVARTWIQFQHVGDRKTVMLSAGTPCCSIPPDTLRPADLHREPAPARGWKFGTSLHVASQAGNDIHFEPVSLTMLVDGPVIAGEYLKVVALTASSEGPPTEIDVAADSAAALDAPPEVWEHYRNLVKQAGILFGAQHYTNYHFLLTLSDHVAHFGLEHHESNDSRIDERALIEEDGRKLSAGLLPMSTCIHGMESIVVRPIWPRLITSSRCRPICCGCMRV